MDTIDTFLATWKASATAYYIERAAELTELRKARIAASAGQRLSVRNNYHTGDAVYRINNVKVSQEKFEASPAYPAYRALEVFTVNATGSEMKILDDVYYDINQGRDPATNGLNKMLTREVERKKASLIKRIEKKAGVFESTKRLTIGVDGNINGTVTGDKATVNVETILAGGYNIQCLHYRVLVK